MPTATAPATQRQTPPRGTMLPEIRAAEVALVMDRAGDLRLGAAERLVCALPDLLGDELLGVELHLSTSGTLTALARVASGGPLVRRRLAFWGARAGARAVALEDLGERERTSFKAGLARSGRGVAAEPGAVAAEARRLFTAAGAPPERAEEAGLALQIDVGGTEWGGVRWDPSRRELFVPGPLAPPPGDELTLSLRVAGALAVTSPARVASVRGADEAGPGALPGFTLSLAEASSELLLVLDQRAEGGEASYEKRRAHPRYAVRAPALVGPAGDEEQLGDPGDLVGSDGRPRFLLENLSLGGAFVHTAERFERGDAVRVVCTLPTGDTIAADAEVVFCAARGMGLRWRLEAEDREELAGVVARIAARPRRALVVDDDPLWQRLLSEGLQAWGFEVIAAGDGVAALQVLSEELLSLDLLVSDLKMPRMDGESLLDTIRRAGGESELAIVMVSGRLGPGLEKKLERDGADAVLRKELGPHFMAQAAAAVLERKRAARPA